MTLRTIGPILISVKGNHARMETAMSLSHISSRVPVDLSKALTDMSRALANLAAAMDEVERTQTELLTTQMLIELRTIGGGR